MGALIKEVEEGAIIIGEGEKRASDRLAEGDEGVIAKFVRNNQ